MARRPRWCRAGIGCGAGFDPCLLGEEDLEALMGSPTRRTRTRARQDSQAPADEAGEQGGAVLSSAALGACVVCGV